MWSGRHTRRWKGMGVCHKVCLSINNRDEKRAVCMKVDAMTLREAKNMKKAPKETPLKSSSGYSLGEVMGKKIELKRTPKSSSK